MSHIDGGLSLQDGPNRTNYMRSLPQSHAAGGTCMYMLELAP